MESILVPGKTRALRHMMLNHIHFRVRDLKAAIAWFQRILQLQPGFHNERIAVFSFGAFTVILDAASVDAPATLGFQSDDCDRDFRAVVERGAMALEPPSNKEGSLLSWPGRPQMRNRGSSGFFVKIHDQDRC